MISPRCQIPVLSDLSLVFYLWSWTFGVHDKKFDLDVNTEIRVCNTQLPSFFFFGECSRVYTFGYDFPPPHPSPPIGSDRYLFQFIISLVILDL